MGAHRYSYVLAHGNIPPRKIVMHTCDNPRCVNPKHLVLGTPKDNTRDMIQKGRKRTVAPKGNENGKAKLTPAIVREIRASKENHAALGRRLGFSANAIRGVRIGRTWSHVT